MHKTSQQASAQISPDREFINGSYRWFAYSTEVTGLPLICLEDLTTGTVVTTTLANPQRRTAAQRAWAGARQSRAAGMPWEILHAMGEKGVDPDQKLEEMFHSYGHASVGDMARLAVDFGRIPMHLCLALFNDGSINSGQEKSTRYQPSFGRAALHPLRHYLPADIAARDVERLEEEYQSFGAAALDAFARHKAALLLAFERYFQVDTSKAAEKSALQARVLDCVRYFLLFGQWSGMSFETSARDWSRIIAELKASPLAYYQKVSAQLEKLLAPTREEEAALNYKAEAPGLIRHTTPQLTTTRNLRTLKEFLATKTDLLQRVTTSSGFPQLVEQQVSMLAARYSEGDRLVAAYILLLWPGLESRQLLEWIAGRDEETKKSISAIIFAGHNNYSELPGFGRTTRMTLLIEGFLGEIRDFNRHRAWGRFIPLPLLFGTGLSQSALQQIIARGFGLPLYLSVIPAFAEHKIAYEQDLQAVLQQAADLY